MNYHAMKAAIERPAIHRIPTTIAQRHALKRVFRRGPIVLCGKTLTYREWRLTVQPTIGMDDAVVVQWAGMWLAIERDGYTHS